MIVEKCISRAERGNNSSRVGSGRIQINERDDAKRRDRDVDDAPRTRFSRAQDTNESYSGRYSRDDSYRGSNYDRDDGRNNRRFDRDVFPDRIIERRKDTRNKVALIRIYCC